MKKIRLFSVFLLFVAVLLSGCGSHKQPQPLLRAEDTARIEVYRYEGVPSSAEKKSTAEPRELEAICKLLSAGSIQKNKKPLAGAKVLSFRVHFKDGTIYETIYTSTAANDLKQLDALWEKLSCQAETAEERELPKLQ